MAMPEKLNEQVYLREEIFSNKKLVFERVVAIVAIGLGATLISDSASSAYLLGIPTLFALAFNFWITVNRLESNARIIAYCQMFHESVGKYNWIGWENSLRLHRTWLALAKNQASSDSERFNDILEYDNLSFFGPIRLFHLSMAILVCAIVSFDAWVKWPEQFPVETLPRLTVPLVYLSLFLVFLIWVIIYGSKDIERGIERNRLDWELIFYNFENGKLEIPNYTPAESKD